MFCIYCGLIKDLNLIAEDLLQNEYKIHDFAKTIGEFRRTTLYAGRALLKLALYDQKLLSSTELLPEFIQGEHGKPLIEGNPFYFNISHAGAHIVLSVGDFEQGLDIEQVRARKHFSALAKRVLTKQEFDFLNTKEELEQLNLFIKWWTIKESLIKASGLGLVGIDRLKIEVQTNQIQAPDNQAGFIYTLSLNQLYQHLNIKPNLEPNAQQCSDLFMSCFSQKLFPQIKVLNSSAIEKSKFGFEPNPSLVFDHYLKQLVTLEQSEVKQLNIEQYLVN